MTTAAIHFALILAGVVFLIAFAVAWHARSKRLDAVLKALLPEADEREVERQRQRDRAAIARQRVVRQEARLRSVDGGRR